TLQRWPGAYQTHVSLQHTEQLRQFVQAIASHPRSYFGDARIVGHFEDRTGHLIECLQRLLHRICVGTHGAKLVACKSTPSPSHDPPAIEYRTGIGDLYRECQNEKGWRKKYQQHERNQNVDNPLGGYAQWSVPTSRH